MKSTGYILDGKYYKSEPKVDQMKNGRAVTDKAYQHDRQRENHRKDIVQPYKKGKPSGEFIRAYPDEARQYFNEQQIRRFGNE